MGETGKGEGARGLKVAGGNRWGRGLTQPVISIHYPGPVDSVAGTSVQSVETGTDVVLSAKCRNRDSKGCGGKRKRGARRPRV